MPNPGRVLVIDDDPEIHRILRLQLSTIGYEVASANDGQQGLDLLETGRFHVVILDLMLPGISGMEVLQRIREREFDVEVIVLTAYASLESAVEALRLGAYDYITKPFAAEVVRSAVERAMEKQQLALRLSTIYDLSQRLALMEDVEQVARIMLDAVRHLMGFGVCNLWLVDEQRGDLYRLMACGPPDDGGGDVPYRLLLDGERGITVAAARSGELVYVADVGDDPRYVAIGPACRSELAIPLKVGGRVIGVLNVESMEADAFRPDDIRLLSTLASQAAVAIQNAMLHEEARRRAAELAAIIKAGQTIVSTLNLNEVVERVLAEARTILEAEGVSVLMYDDETDELVFTASVGLASDVLVGIRMPSDTGIAGWVLKTKKAALVQDTQSDPRFYDRIDDLTGLSTRSLLAVPLVCKGKTIGVLEAVNREEEPFDEHDLDLLSALASSAAIAIENARLHEETVRRLAESRVLQEVTLAASSTLDFDQVLTRTIQAIHDTLQVDYLVFALPDESGDFLRVHSSLIGFVPPSDKYLRLPMDGSACGRVYTSGRPELVEDLAGTSHYFEETPGVRSILVVPVQLEGRTIAVLGVGSTSPAAFDREDLRMFEAIAAQLGIVMENARLYEAEREQRRLVEQSRAQLVQSEKLAATGRLAASLAHEINNPLQAIHNSLQLMLTFPLEPDEQREYLQMASEEVERLMRLVARMLDFARRPRKGMKPTSLNDVIEKVLTLCSKYLQHHRVTLRRDLAPDLPPVLANADELSQVFLNLILNAVDAMPEGGTLRVSSRLMGDGRLEVTFSDTGHGIPPEHLDRIFEPFFTTKENGSGLGLTVSHSVIERHGGEISVRTLEGEGTTFTVRLPAAAEGDDEAWTGGDGDDRGD